MIVSPLDFFLGIMRGMVLASLLSLLPTTAFSIAEQSADTTLSESTRGIARISDPHGWLNHEERAALEQRLGEFWKHTGVKISILVDSPPNGRESLESFSKRIATTWGLTEKYGQPGGILLVIDPRAKRAALNVSTELETDFPSGEINRIINGNVNPMLMHGDLADGITLAVERVSVFLEQPNRINSSLFARGYGILASAGLFFTGMILRRRWGAMKSAVTVAFGFGALVCLDGFNLGFSWYGVLFCAALSSFLLGLFVWVGMGNDSPADATKQ